MSITRAMILSLQHSKKDLMCVKTCLRSTMVNNQIQTLMLMHVCKNILNKINLADITNEFVHRKNSCKETLQHSSQNFHNIYKVKLKLRYFNILIFGMKCI